MGRDAPGANRAKEVVRVSSDVWTIIKIEAYCLEGCDPTGKASKYVYDIDGHELENPYYDPTYKAPPKPEWCPGDPCYECLCRECVHFAYCEHEEIGDCND